MSQAKASKCLANVAHFGSGSAQELAANGSVVKQVSHFDARARSSVPRPYLRQFSAVAGNHRAAWFFMGPRLQRYLSDAADGGQRFAAKTHRLNVKKIIGGSEFAGSMTGEGERQIVGDDAAAIIDNADEIDAALLDFDIDAAAA